MRYELKMTFDVKLTQYMIKKLFMSPLAFKEIFHERQVNNIYFDTFDYDDLKANIDGLYHRSKFRVRWYGTETTFYPSLEEKIKKGQLGTKKIVDFDDLLTKEDILSNYKSLQLDDIEMSLRFTNRHPVLFNSYQRRYFMSSNNKIRVTLDHALKFSHPKNKLKTIEDHRLAILELKFEEEDYQYVQSLIQSLGFRFDKNSKYVNGMYMVFER